LHSSGGASNIDLRRNRKRKREQDGVDRKLTEGENEWPTNKSSSKDGEEGGGITGR
jgi:hypothetical protein